MPMPSVEVGMEAGRLVELLVQVGATVTVGQPLFVVEAEKVTLEIEAPAAGIESVPPNRPMVFDTVIVDASGCRRRRAITVSGAPSRVPMIGVASPGSIAGVAGWVGASAHAATIATNMASDMRWKNDFVFIDGFRLGRSGGVHPPPGRAS